MTNSTTPAAPRNTEEQLVRPGCYAGTDITPQDGDIVEWISNGARWQVCKEDDLEGPSALHHWEDGGWCRVRLIHRPNAGGESPATQKKEGSK